MTTYRIHRQPGFTQVPNDAIRDARISFRARGIHHWLLSQKDVVVTSSEELAEVTTEGRDAIRTALQELEAAGYLLRGREHDDQGRLVNVCHVYDLPPNAGNPPEKRGAPRPENPSSVPTREKDEKAQVAPMTEKPSSVSFIENTKNTIYPPSEGGAPKRGKVSKAAAARALRGPNASYPPEFEELWSAYPKVANSKKAQAFDVWKKRLADGFKADEMLKGARAYARTMNAPDAPHPKHLETFLGPRHHFLDYALEPEAAAPSNWMEAWA